ncbi:chitin synthase chs-2-like [Watersipora subatra]|uniref:chitin synthase chs-2-like n=1 Tax=Watersipora subatra TaxID=2589382 RepID=UPI00355B2A86
MDFDHFIRRSARELSHKVDPDFYNFETHIFFDDAFTAHNNTGEDFNVNGYVKSLIKVVPEAVRKHYSRELGIVIKDPVKVPTPYGGRLEWELPSKTKLIAHLKDKVKIRHKKRWSQVKTFSN